MKKIFFIIFCILLLWGGSFYYKNLRGAFSPVAPAPIASPDIMATSVYASDIPNARVLVWDPQGKLLVSSPATGKVFALPEKTVVAEGLNKPHGLAFHAGKLYIAETDAVAVYDYDGKATNRKKIIDLPGGGNHFSRTIGFGPDGKLYVSIGSSCNACVEKDPRRAAIWVANVDGSDFHLFASGLRNSVFFAWREGQMWATDMGRDLIGDNIPPEEVNIISEGKNYGWPYCYSNQIPDTTLGGTEEQCKKTVRPIIEYQAHSAPLGLTFDTNYLYVAMHGSWNRTEPTGHKIVRFDLANDYAPSDFITDIGRPVDLLFDDMGNLFISDDKAGVVYKVTQK